jgi:hypothetical protein
LENQLDTDIISDQIITINKIITKNLQNITGSDNFDFAWYKNPKPTIKEFFHVQVFWSKL